MVLIKISDSFVIAILSKDKLRNRRRYAVHTHKKDNKGKNKKFLIKRRKSQRKLSRAITEI